MDNPATPEVEVNLNPLNELFNILTQANREQDAQIVNLVQKYFQVMEAQQKAVNEELQNIQKQLNQLTEMGEKLQNDSRIMDAVKMLEQGAKEAPEQTKQAKRTIFQKAAGIIRDFKLRGLIALNKIVQKLGLKEMYKESKVKLDGQIDKTIKAIDKLNAISYEVNEAKVHTGNIFRVLTGGKTKLR
jgi:predicted nuclease with TOPRIM domain